MRLVPAGVRRRLDPRWSRSRERWRAAGPTTNLTWGAEVSGDAFIERAAGHGAFGPDRHVLEIGPGYGRLLDAANGTVEFASWTGVDLSAENVAYLQKRYDDPRVSFVQAEVETVRLETAPDSVVSSLTFKHLFPSFEAALANLTPQLVPGATLTFDLIEGEGSYFEDDGVTYIRWYSKTEVEEILRRCGLEPAGFDEVRHLPELTRMLVLARKPS
jgi:ubiquinone/menaquinone biosynthesis C-methylase UbiE